MPSHDFFSISYGWKIKHPLWGKLRFILKIITTYKTWVRVLWSAYARPAGEATLQLRNGLRYIVRPRADDLGMLNETIILGCYDWLTKRIGPTSVVIDVGAQMGDFTVLAAHRAKLVIAVEPESGNCTIIRKNMRINKLTNIRLAPVALGGKQGYGTLFLGSSSTHSLRNKTDNGTRVRIDTLASIMRRERISHIDCLKLDCEGMEQDVVRTAPLSRISAIMMEVHPRMVDVAWIKKHLRKSGFHVETDREYLVAYKRA